MRVFDIIITIKSIEEKIDKTGARFLKARGWCAEKNIHGITRSFFASIQLYGTNGLLDETKNRLWLQTAEKPKLKLQVYDSDLTLPLINGKSFSILKVYYYDFFTKKVGTKKQMKLDYQNVGE